MAETVLEHVNNIEADISEIRQTIKTLNEGFKEIIAVMGNLEYKLNALETEPSKKSTRTKNTVVAEIEQPVPQGRKFPSNLQDWLCEAFETNNKNIINLIPANVYKNAEQQVMSSKAYKSADNKQKKKNLGLSVWLCKKSDSELKDKLNAQFQKEKQAFENSN